MPRRLGGSAGWWGGCGVDPLAVVATAMTDDEFEAWLAGRTEDQCAAMGWVRSLVTGHAPDLDESVTTGRWLAGFVFYSAVEQMVFAIGPKDKTKTTFHMMPFFGSPVLQERHGSALAPFVTGRSCIAFRRAGEVPAEAPIDIIEQGTPVMRAMLERRAGRTPSG